MQRARLSSPQSVGQIQCSYQRQPCAISANYCSWRYTHKPQLIQSAQQTRNNFVFLTSMMCWDNNVQARQGTLGTCWKEFTSSSKVIAQWKYSLCKYSSYISMTACDCIHWKTLNICIWTSNHQRSQVQLQFENVRKQLTISLWIPSMAINLHSCSINFIRDSFTWRCTSFGIIVVPTLSKIYDQQRRRHHQIKSKEKGWLCCVSK